jgi:hypothetical protein
VPVDPVRKARVAYYNWRRRHPNAPMLAPGGEITMLNGVQHVALTTVCGVEVLVSTAFFIAQRTRIVAWGEGARRLIDATIDIDSELDKLVAVEQRKRNSGDAGVDHTGLAPE